MDQTQEGRTFFVGVMELEMDGVTYDFVENRIVANMEEKIDYVATVSDFRLEGNVRIMELYEWEDVLLLHFLLLQVLHLEESKTK